MSFFFFFFFFLICWLGCMGSNGDQTLGLCVGSAGSEPLDAQGNPFRVLFQLGSDPCVYLVPIASRPMRQPHTDHSFLDTVHPPVQCSYVSLMLMCCLPLASPGRVSFSFKTENLGRFPGDSLAVSMGPTHFL